ncbi:MAG TPA: glutamine--fructose-6-phosphate transaminase (isomerizing) [Candidatus Omnitrophota bacterium]|nr:glutamine--fructose-6-phosphate transaminase (isomerizing) [Candidatus Omnitrophota bacterium]HPS36522.1 glutamine--fructose-6-phosphate transaminase (isomerizing) [Candidatus Omnitrophota bacterium]
MCGIIGYVGYRNTIPVLVQGLEQLEYRGYDSAGIACLNHQKGNLFLVKEKGKLNALKEKLGDFTIDAHIGIGHTRWATHGEPSRANAHPHTDATGRIALVHNGIIENYATIKSALQKKGVRFSSQTDTEVGAKLIGAYYRKKANLFDAVRQAVNELHGFFAFVLFSKEDPETIIAYKRSNPLVIGLGQGENFIASDVTALLPYTRQVIYLEDEDLAVITAQEVSIYSTKTRSWIKRHPTTVHWNVSQAQKQGFPHFMLKEMHEQPEVLKNILGKRIDKEGEIFFDTLDKKFLNRLKKIEQVFMVSCGTAHHAGLVGSIALEQYAKIPCRTQVSSEFRYGNPILGKKDLVVLITQSGETADTLAALREAKGKGAATLAIVNVVGSTIAREADSVIYTHAGPEIGVASTKAYIAQLAALLLLALYIGKTRKAIPAVELKNILREFKKIPDYCAKVLKEGKRFALCAQKHYTRRNFLYLGRGCNYPTALEGALKLKEISYAHAHGYAAGEMKHGPIALIDHEQPVICIAPASLTYDKMVSNIQEIRARDGIVIVIGTEGNRSLEKMAEDFFSIPKVPEILSPLLTVVPLQFFAYKIAVLNGRDVDQPRNLAKSVTVE